MTTRGDTPDLQPCPCCGEPTISARGEYEICEVCGWEDDPVQSAEPDFAGGANVLSLEEARNAWFARQGRHRD